MTGIKNRVDDALLLWEADRKEGAFLSVLIAVAAVARIRYPKLKDRESFEQFIRDSNPTILNVEYRGDCKPIEHILYKWLRCQLVHEGGLPFDIQFTNETKAGAMSVRAGGAPEYILKIGHGWFHHMIASVMQAKENGTGSSKESRA